MASIRQRLKPIAGIGLVNLATATWATNMALGRWLRNDIGPLTLAASRFLVVSIFFAILLQRRPAEERHLGKDRWLLLGMALSGVALFAPTLYLGLRYTTAVSSTLINGLGPLITGLLAPLLIQEPMSRRQLVGAIVGLVGVLILISNGSLAFWQAIQSNVGELIVLGAVSLWALYSVLGRRVMRQRSALSATAFSAFLGLPLLLLAACWELWTLPMDLRPALIPAILYIGIVPGVIGFLAWNEGVRRLGSSGAMVFYNTLPLYGGLLGVLFLGESVGITHLIGGVLIMGGGIWAARGHSSSMNEVPVKMAASFCPEEDRHD
jgi:drug/metabolite transporter (DMT)-like permease